MNTLLGVQIVAGAGARDVSTKNRTYLITWNFRDMLISRFWCAHISRHLNFAILRKFYILIHFNSHFWVQQFTFHRQCYLTCLWIKLNDFIKGTKASKLRKTKHSTGQTSYKFTNTLTGRGSLCKFYSFKWRKLSLQTHMQQEPIMLLHIHNTSSVVSYAAVFVSIFTQVEDKKRAAQETTDHYILPPYHSSCSLQIWILL